MKNKFKFYTGKEFNQDNAKATKAVLQAIDDFKLNLMGILNKFCRVGSDDTQSREAVVNYLKKEIEKGGFI